VSGLLAWQVVIVDDPQSRLAPYLMSDERLLWSGQPDPTKIFSAADLFLIPFSLIWGGFAIFWEVGVVAHGSLLFSLFGLPFVAMGLYFIFGRFVVKSRRKRQTSYGLTDRRALVAWAPGRCPSRPCSTSPSSNVVPATANIST
jgi:hypothetical protein